MLTNYNDLWNDFLYGERLNEKRSKKSRQQLRKEKELNSYIKNVTKKLKRVQSWEEIERILKKIYAHFDITKSDFDQDLENLIASLKAEKGLTEAEKKKRGQVTGLGADDIAKGKKGAFQAPDFKMLGNLEKILSQQGNSPETSKNVAAIVLDTIQNEIEKKNIPIPKPDPVPEPEQEEAATRFQKFLNQLIDQGKWYEIKEKVESLGEENFEKIYGMSAEAAIQAAGGTRTPEAEPEEKPSEATPEEAPETPETTEQPPEQDQTQAPETGQEEDPATDQSQDPGEGEKGAEDATPEADGLPAKPAMVSLIRSGDVDAVMKIIQAYKDAQPNQQPVVTENEEQADPFKEKYGFTIEQALQAVKKHALQKGVKLFSAGLSVLKQNTSMIRSSLQQQKSNYALAKKRGEASPENNLQVKRFKKRYEEQVVEFSNDTESQNAVKQMAQGVAILRLYNGFEILKMNEERALANIKRATFPNFLDPELGASEPLRKAFGANEEELKAFLAGFKSKGLPSEIAEDHQPARRRRASEIVNEEEDNPWAICTASVGRDDKEKYEDCVMSVKKQKGLDEAELEEKKKRKKRRKRKRRAYGYGGSYMFDTDGDGGDGGGGE